MRRLIEAVNLARRCLPPGGSRRKRRERPVLQLFRVKLSLGGQPQNAARKLVRPNLVVTVELERQPRLVKRCFQHRKRLWTERSTSKPATACTDSSSAKCAHVPSPQRNSWNQGLQMAQHMADIV